MFSKAGCIAFSMKIDQSVERRQWEEWENVDSRENDLNSALSGCHGNAGRTEA